MILYDFTFNTFLIAFYLYLIFLCFGPNFASRKHLRQFDCVAFLQGLKTLMPRQVSYTKSYIGIVVIFLATTSLCEVCGRPE